MQTYDCKTNGCEGKISFPPEAKDESDRPPVKGGMGLAVTFVGEIPQQCPRCHISFYESELRT
jgi:hypothetical protein